VIGISEDRKFQKLMILRKAVEDAEKDFLSPLMTCFGAAGVDCGLK